MWLMCLVWWMCWTGPEWRGWGGGGGVAGEPGSWTGVVPPVVVVVTPRLVWGSPGVTGTAGSWPGGSGASADTASVWLLVVAPSSISVSEEVSCPSALALG